MPKGDEPGSGQAAPSGWDMSQEREFIENLLSERFNFFLVFFSLVIAGVLSASAVWHLWTVLVFGTLICFLLALTLFRAQQKLDVILAILSEDKQHPAKISDDLAQKPEVRAKVPFLVRWSIAGSRRRLIGYWIPLLCVLFLILLFVLALLGVINPETGNVPQNAPVTTPG
jgi:glucan phosphoethanolaminetransferase (alkaline phosphatase superfamily)